LGKAPKSIGDLVDNAFSEYILGNDLIKVETSWALFSLYLQMWLHEKTKIVKIKCHPLGNRETCSA
jgi:hypothetical protein